MEKNNQQNSRVGNESNQPKAASSIDGVIPMDSTKNGANQAWSSISQGFSAAKVC